MTRLPEWRSRVEAAFDRGCFALSDIETAQRGYTPVVERLAVERPGPKLMRLDDLTREAQLVHAYFARHVKRHNLFASNNAVLFLEKARTIMADDEVGYKLVRDFDCEPPEVYGH